MKPKKISFEEIRGILSRAEMKKIKAGCGSGDCNFSINCMIGGGFQSGGTCTGPSDPDYGCAPTEESCYDQSNAWCAGVPGCDSCVPY